jgi:hypothetical protein
MINAQKNEPASDNAPRKDWFLQFLVNTANKSHFELELTLNVGGFLISGTLAGVKQYFSEVGADFAGSFKAGKGSEEITAAFKKIGDECACVSNAEPAESPSYIHLKNARFYDAQGHSFQRKNDLWWRGRISEVQGFIPGNLVRPAASSASGK